MIDFRQHKDLIRELVKSEDALDRNWKWSVHSICKSKVMIRWGYLDYMEEKEPHNCFSLEVKHDRLGNGWCESIIWRDPDGNMISFCDIGPSPFDDYDTVEPAIAHAIRCLASYAHSRY